VSKCEAISKRKVPALATVTVQIVSEGAELLLEAPGMEALRLPTSTEAYSNERGGRVECSGRSTTQGDAGWYLGSIDAWQHEKGSEWISRYLNRDAGDGRLLSGKKRANYGLMRSQHGLSMESYPPAFPLIAKANVDHQAEYETRFKDNEKRFADFAPLLLVNRASATFVGERGGKREGEAAYPIGSFRGNIVVHAEAAWAEESWSQIEVGGVTLRKIKECPRCTVPCRDETTGGFVFPEDKMRLWRLLRKAFPAKNADAEWGSWAGPFFGVYFGHAGQQGTLSVGDPISVLHTAPWDAHMRMSASRRALLFAFVLALCVAIVAIIMARRID